MSGSVLKDLPVQEGVNFRTHHSVRHLLAQLSEMFMPSNRAAEAAHISTGSSGIDPKLDVDQVAILNSLHLV